MAEEIIITVSEGTQEIVMENIVLGETVVEESGAMVEIVVENIQPAEIIVEDQIPAAEIVVEYGAIINYNGGGNPGFGFEKYTYVDGLVSMIEIFEDETEALLLYTQNFTYNINGSVLQIITIREPDSVVVSTEDFVYDLNGDLLTYHKY